MSFLTWWLFSARDGERDGGVRLPRPGRADREGDVVLPRRRDEAHLPRRLGLDHAARRREQDDVGRVGARDPVADHREVEDRIDVALGEVAVAREHARELREDLLDALDLGVVATEDELVAARGDAGVRERGFDLTEVGVVEAEQQERLDALDGQGFFSQTNGKRGVKGRGGLNARRRRRLPGFY